MHQSDDDDRAAFLVDPIDNPVWKSVKAATAVRIVQRLPCVQILQHQIQRASILIEHLQPQAPFTKLILVEGALKIVLGVLEDDRVHLWPRSCSR
jgi:hypothetical protein